MARARVVLPLLLGALAGAACRERAAPAKDPAAAIFEAELARRGVSFTPAPEANLYVIDVRGTAVTVSLANVSRDLARDGDPEAVRRIILMPGATVPGTATASCSSAIG